MNFKKLILDDLKKQGLTEIIKKIKSIRYKSYSGGDSVRVQTLDLWKGERETLKGILEQYQEGSFDGMNDIYINKQGPSEKARTAKYIFLENEFSDSVREGVKEYLKSQWDIVDDTTARERMDCWYDQAIDRRLNELEGSL